MAQSFQRHSRQSGNGKHSTASEECDDSKEGDDDSLRYNNRLKERRNRLLEELTTLEQENKSHYDKLRELLKPLRLLNKQNDDDDDEPDLDEYEENTINALDGLDGFEEFELRRVTEHMSEEQKRDFLALLIRFLCVSNNYQRNEIKSLYAKQSSLYFQAQCLSLDEQREFHDAVSLPKPAFQTTDKQNSCLIQQLLAKFPNPHAIAEEYEQYVKFIKKININAKDEEDTSWQNSVIHDMDAHDAYEQKPGGNTPIKTPSISSKHSGSSGEDTFPYKATVAQTPTQKISGLFRFTQRKQQQEIPQTLQENAPISPRERESASTLASVSRMPSAASSVASAISYRSSNPNSSRHTTKLSVDLMGPLTNAPEISAPTRHTGLSGPRLIRFDPNYKQLSSRRRRCDVATIIAAFQNTHKLHAKMKRGVQTAGQNPFLREENYGFDMRYSNGNIYIFDTILEDKERMRRHKEESKRNNEPMSPSMRPLKSGGTLHYGHIQSLDSIVLSAQLTARSTCPPSIMEDDDMEYTYTYEDMISSPKPVMNVRMKEEQSTNNKRGWITLNQFIHLATNFGAHGQRDAQILVLTHKTFCESKLLLKGFRKRFWMPYPPNITPSEMATFRTTYVKQIRGKIIAVLRFWLTKHYNDDFREDFALQKRMNKFISEINKNEEAQAMSIYLAQAFERQKKENAMTRKRVADGSQAQMAQIAQKKKVVKFFYDTKTIDILDFEPEQTAACITELNCASFLLIDQRECFEWIKQKEKAPHVASMIARWSAMVNWMQRELLSTKRDFKKRLDCLRYFIQIVNILSEWGDFSGAYAINSALHSTPVHRLKRYFAELTRKEHSTLQDMSALFTVSGNYPNLRAKMKHYLSKPCVPHIGLFTRDFTMLAEQQSKKMIGDVKYINFGKCQALAKQIGDLKMYQNNINKFNLKGKYQKPLLDYVETQLENPNLSEKELYKVSVKVEPRANIV